MARYVIPGKSDIHNCEQGITPPAGAVPMVQERPSFDAIAQADGTWLEPAVDPLEARKAAYKAEADDLYMDYKAAEEEGQDAAVVESLRQTWLARRAEIKAAWPK